MITNEERWLKKFDEFGERYDCFLVISEFAPLSVLHFSWPKGSHEAPASTTIAIPSAKHVPNMYRHRTTSVSGLDPFGSGRRWTSLSLTKSPNICRNLFQVHDHSRGIAKEPRTALQENLFVHLCFNIFHHVSSCSTFFIIFQHLFCHDLPS